MTTIALLCLSAALSLALAAFCAGAETAFLSVSRERVLHLAREGGRKAKKVEKALSSMAHTTTTLLIGNNIASVAYSTSTTALIVATGAEWRALWGFVAAFTVLYVSEFMPKMLCSARPLRRSLKIAGAYGVLAAVLRPLTAVALAVTGLFIPRRPERKYELTSSDLMRILEDRKDGVCLSDIESALIGRIMVLRLKRRPITAEAILSALRTDSGQGQEAT